MANNENLKKGEATRFKSGEEAVKNGRKGGIASGQSKRENKTFQTIISEILQRDIASSSQIEKLAAQIGLQGDKSIKELYSYIVMLKTLKRANLGDLKLLCELLGEEPTSANSEQEEQHNDLIEALRSRNENKHVE